MRNRKLLTFSLASSTMLFATAAQPQDIGDEGTSGATTVTPGGGTTVVVNPQPATVTQQTTHSTFGLPSQDYDPDKGLPSSAREAGEDRFDLKGAGSSGTIRGSESGSFVLGENKSVGVPVYHEVKRGETLWDICVRYYDNPYCWPKLWSYNPQIENPHWIYPGDRLRLRRGDTGSQPLTGNSFIRKQGVVPPGTIFLRDRGYLGDESRDVMGTVVGSPDDQMLLSEGDEMYFEVRNNQPEPRLGQEYSIFRPTRKPEEGKAPGKVVHIQGTVRVTAWDRDNRMARGTVIESLDVIERGAWVGPVGRRFDVVPPVPNDREVWGVITGGIEPRELIGQNQIVFVDKGSKDGIRPGNRFFAVTQGDKWRQSLPGSGDLAASHVRYQLRSADVDTSRNYAKGRKFPKEVIGELQVIRTEEHSATCLVTFAELELEPGAPVLARRGY